MDVACGVPRGFRVRGRALDASGRVQGRAHGQALKPSKKQVTEGGKWITGVARARDAPCKGTCAPREGSRRPHRPQTPQPHRQPRAVERRWDGGLGGKVSDRSSLSASL